MSEEIQTVEEVAQENQEVVEKPFADKDYDKQTPTFGQKAVGYSFNPSQNENVEILKRKAASTIDEYNELRNQSEDGEVKRMLSLAITKAQEASMRAIKAITWHMN